MSRHDSTYNQVHFRFPSYRLFMEANNFRNMYVTPGRHIILPWPLPNVLRYIGIGRYKDSKTDRAKDLGSYGHRLSTSPCDSIQWEISKSTRIHVYLSIHGCSRHSGRIRLSPNIPRSKLSAPGLRLPNLELVLSRYFT